MKKYFMLLMCCLFLISCEKDYKTYSLEEKKEIFREALTEEDGKNEKSKKLEKILEEIEKAAKNGDKKAEAELEEWAKVMYGMDRF